ncbi:hypothetical protein [Rhodoflexus caldus]|uniref:hypothetical protein n=1 Tax=Rhodoflexus caldus TaxID=2891236 RepID=UPI002029D30A|nr:hypothetical protein [Rhodoflexus caldus]
MKIVLLLWGVCLQLSAAAQIPDSVLTEPRRHAEWWLQRFPTVDLPRDTLHGILPHAVFGYEAGTINWQPLQLPKQVYRITGVDIVFSLYPKDIRKWDINYYELLAARIKSVLQRFPKLNRPNVQWRAVRQTAANNRTQAAALFHGVVFHVELKPPDTSHLAWERAEAVLQRQQLRDRISRFYRRPDYTETVVRDFFSEHERLAGSVIVMDWTGSMYPYGIDVILQQFFAKEEESATAFVFFNDGGNAPPASKKIGKTGGIYHANPRDMEEVYRMMRKVAEDGNGVDTPENDIEALIAAEQKYPSAARRYLIADNRSPVRDLRLMTQLTQPVDVILCNTNFNLFGKKFRLINSDYVRLTAANGGHLYADGIPEPLSADWEKLPRLTVERHSFYVIGEDFNLQIPQSITLLFDQNGITVSQRDIDFQPQEISKMIGFNEENFPDIIKLNELLTEKGKRKPSKKALQHADKMQTKKKAQ